MIDTSHTSPNQSSRNGADISMIVIHATVGSYAASLAWLCNPESNVSTHYLIAKTGYTARLVPDDRAAWHAGVSHWMTMDSGQIQRQSIGIELENKNNGVDPYPQPQLAALLTLCRKLVAAYAIVPDMVALHADVAIPDGRKTDAAAFHLDTFKAALFAPLSGAYRVRGLPVYQRSDHTGTVAGYVHEGDAVEIDNPANGHLSSGWGFVDMNALEAL
jgi:N-acetyl-anhydromuramyl-L-alanine amidase AmpD